MILGQLQWHFEPEHKDNNCLGNERFHVNYQEFISLCVKVQSFSSEDDFMVSLIVLLFVAKGCNICAEGSARLSLQCLLSA